MRGGLTGWVLVVLVGPVFAEGQTGQQIVERGIAAHGGKSALQKALIGQRTDKGKCFLDSGEAEIRRTLWFSLPSRTRQDITIGERVKTVVVLDGARAWQNDGGATVSLGKRRVRELQEEADTSHLLTLLPLLEKDVQLVALPGEKDSERVAVRRKDRSEVTLTFAGKSGLLSQLSRQTTLAGEKVVIHHHFSEYKIVNQVQVPTRETVSHGEKKVGEWAIEWRYHATAPKETFARP